MRKLLDVLLASGVIFVLALLVARIDEPQTIAGFASVVDGDTLIIGDERIRLYGVDAPELSQTCKNANGEYACGHAAKRNLEGLAGGVLVTCRAENRDRYGRLLAQCAANNLDLAEEMVRLGWAISYGAYHDIEKQAKAERRGIWSGDFETPQAWRRTHNVPDGEENSFATWLAETLGAIFSRDHAGGGKDEAL